MSKNKVANYEQYVAHHEKILWTRFVMVILGVWLFFVPIAFDYYNSSWAVMINDMTVGVLVVLCSFLAFSPTSKFFPYLLAIFGVWLNFAPLVFWAPKSVMYLNDTLVGSLIIAFSILIPSVPGESLNQGPEVPAGWSYNPSSWPQRLPTICLAVVSWFLARYMAAYQMGYSDNMWDPFFGNNGTLKVITSDLSKSFPISDAGMGAMAYCLEFLMGAKGGVRRWYTMPWLVVLFGILVVPLGIVSILLVCSQPIIVHHWCTWCLLAAFCCMFMITFAVNEVVAVCQYIVSECKKGRGWWDVLWSGGVPANATKDTRTPGFLNSKGKIFASLVWGVTVPWNLVLTALFGAWFMLSPAVLNITGMAANNEYIFGALTIVISFICFAEVIRIARYILILVGAWEIIAIWVLKYPPFAGGVWINFVIAVLLIFASLPKGPIREKYGSWDRFVR